MEPDVQAFDSVFLCPICLEEIATNEIFSQLNSCNHNICESCFKQLIYYSDNCPLCGLQFSGCLYIKDNKIIHQHILTEIELQSVKNNKNSYNNGTINFKAKFLINL
jgi:hypothetical protein